MVRLKGKLLNLVMSYRLILLTGWLLPASAIADPVFTSDPVENGKVDQLYQYDITTSDWWFIKLEIILLEGQLPKGIKLKDFGNGKGELKGTPEEAGKFPITLRVQRKNEPSEGQNQSFILTIDKGEATIQLSDLVVTYDGAQHIPSVKTSPKGLDVEFRFNGSTTPPVNAGSYNVNAIIDDPNYQGSTTGVMVINKAQATIHLANLTATYDGHQKQVSVSTTPAGLRVDLTYNGSSSPPINAGEYLVQGSVNDINYSGTTSGTLVIKKQDASITFDQLVFTYDGSPKAVKVITSPPDLSVVITYDEAASPPSAVGNYSVKAIINELNYQGTATGTLVINQSAGGANGKPVISNLEKDPLIYYQGDSPVGITNQLIINDFDNVNMMEAKVAVTSHYVAGEDILSYDNSLNEKIHGEFNESTGILLLTGEDTRSQYEEALAQVKYQSTTTGEPAGLEKTLTITVNDGIYTSDPVIRNIEIRYLPELDIVNAFTPNGDLVNDSWDFINLDAYAEIDIFVLDKKGRKVYSCSGYECAWDGTYNGELLPAGVYFYTINLDSGRKKYRGTVTILR